MNTLVRYLPILLLLVLWDAACRFGWASTDIMPTPQAVAVRWWELMQDGEIATHAGASLFREGAGLGLSIVVGMTIGIVMAVSKDMERVVQPLITFFYPLPKSALIPVIIIWLGLGHSAQITVIFLGCLLPVIMSAFNGARGVEQALVWSARSLGASRLRIIQDVVIRSAMPEILVGIRVALALSFVLLVSAEMIGARQGMGFLINFLGDTGEYAGMFAVVFTLIAFGFAADRAYLALMRRALRWREA